MKGNGMRTWFRGAKTLASGFFRKHGQMGAQAPVSTFLISVGFVAVIFFAIISWMWWWFPYHLFSDEVYDIVAVNAPQSFIDYNQYMQTSRDLTSKEYGSRTDLFSNFDNIIRFNYTYDGYGATRFIYKENHALYDFVTFGKWMAPSILWQLWNPSLAMLVTLPPSLASRRRTSLCAFVDPLA